MALGSTVRIHRSTSQPNDARERCGRAVFSAGQISPTRTIVAVAGDIDALNARALGRFVERHIRFSRQLVLDLRAVDFAGSQTFTALYYVSVYCTRGDVDWCLVGSGPLRRLLSICDPDGELPLADDLTSGLSRLDRMPMHRHPARPAG